uniref:BABA1 protein n=1 Tax=Zonotrichia albicollis TaxID=44394 RepID=A0A8D2MMI4_ZONAL
MSWLHTQAPSKSQFSRRVSAGPALSRGSRSLPVPQSSRSPLVPAVSRFPVLSPFPPGSRSLPVPLTSPFCPSPPPAAVLSRFPSHPRSVLVPPQLQFSPGSPRFLPFSPGSHSAPVPPVPSWFPPDRSLPVPSRPAAPPVARTAPPAPAVFLTGFPLPLTVQPPRLGGTAGPFGELSPPPNPPQKPPKNPKPPFQIPHPPRCQAGATLTPQSTPCNGTGTPKRFWGVQENLGVLGEIWGAVRGGGMLVLGQQKVELPVTDNVQTIPPPFVVRTILVFGRPHCQPHFCGGEHVKKLLQCPYFFFDVVYIHNGMDEKEDESSWKDMFGFFGSLDTKGTNYKYEVALAGPALELHNCMAKLLAHPLQRPCQSHAHYGLLDGGDSPEGEAAS